MLHASRMPFPARALAGRLLNHTERQSWGGFLPPDLRREPEGPEPTAFEQSTTQRSCATACSLPAEAPPIHRSSGSSARRDEAPRQLPPSAFGQAGYSLGSPVKKVVAEKKLKGSLLLDDVWELSRDKAGCRRVQDAFEAGPDLERLVLIEHLKGRVWEALRCPNANYVIQKSITTTRPEHSQFIIDELLQGSCLDAATGPAWAARHRYGCRVVERLLEHCPPMQVKSLVDSILMDALQLSIHPYGNYVMQHILEHGAHEHKHKICRLLHPLSKTLGSAKGSEYVCAVFGKALCHGSREDRAQLARSVIMVPGLLNAMACSRYGHVTAKLVLQAADCVSFEAARTQLTATADSLRQSRYGRFVIALMDQAPAATGVPSRSLQRAGGA